MNYEDHRAFAEMMGFEPVPPCPESDNGIHKVQPVLSEDGRWTSSPCIRCGVDMWTRRSD